MLRCMTPRLTRTFAFAVRVLGDRAAAEAALLDAYVEIWRWCGRLDVDGLCPMVWISMIVHRVAAKRVPSAAAGPDGEPDTQGRQPVGGKARHLWAVPDELRRVGSPLAELSAQRDRWGGREYHASGGGEVDVPSTSVLGAHTLDPNR